LQTAPRWASITGRLRSSTDRVERAFVLIVDDSTREATLDVDGRPRAVYTLR